MEIQKKQLKKMIRTRDDQDIAYKQIISGFSKYEDNNLEYYSESDVARRILTNPVSGSEFNDKFNQEWKTLRNPYREAYIWLKGELLDLKGLSQALAGRENVVRLQSSTESKKRSDQQELEKVSQGKTTLKSLFKSKSSKESGISTLQVGIEAANKDIEGNNII